MRRLFVILAIAFSAGCSEGGVGTRTDAAALGDARDVVATEATVVLDSQYADSRRTDDVVIDGTGTDLGSDASDTGTADSGDVADAPLVTPDGPSDTRPPAIDGQRPALDGPTATDVVHQDGGAYGPLSVDSSTTSPDGTSAADVASDGPAPPRDEADAWACNAPACWTDLMKDCQPSGTCRQQISGETSNRCYANGVRVLATVHGVATMTTTVKNGTRTCFELVFDMSGSTTVGSIRSGNGTTVATITDAPSGRSAIACAGHDAVILNEACDSLPWIVGVCESGDCNP